MSLKLLSNGKYHVMLAAQGSGWSRWGDVALTRWREDARDGDGGTFFYLRDAETGDTWRATNHPKKVGADASAARFDAADARLLRPGQDIETTLDVAVATDGDVELRRLRITNLSSRTRRLSVTSLAEIVLAPAAKDAAHLAFSKLFVETEFDSGIGAVVATRRPSAASDPRIWLFHTAVAHGETGPISFETDRMAFIGRGRDDSAPAALLESGPLGSQVGPVLDAIAAIRIPFDLPAHASYTVDWFTGVAASRLDCLTLAARSRTAGRGDVVLADATRYRDATLLRSGASAPDGMLFERLAGQLFHADAAWRGESDQITANRRGQSGLWGFGISGDLPLVLVRVTGARGLVLVRQFVQAHAFWAAHGVACELMVVTGSSPASTQPGVHEHVLRAIGDASGADQMGKRAGIFVCDDSTLDEGDRALLESVARIVVSDASGNLAEQLARRERPDTVQALAPAATPHTEGADANPASAEALVCSNGHGGFSSDLREYVITLSTDQMTPAPWINVIANPEFGTLVSESGSASTWSENAHEFRLTPWSNDPVSDPCTEAFYLRDEESGRFWSPTLLPTRSVGPFVARHGFGYSSFEHIENEIASTLRVFVAIDAPVKFSAFAVHNRSARTRRISLTGYLEWVLGDERAKTMMQVVTGLDEETGALIARNAYNVDFGGRIAFFDVEGEKRSVCGDRLDFLGASGTLAAPAALAREHLSNRVGAALDPCAALRVAIDLAPGEEREVIFRLGAAKSTDEATQLVRRWRGDDAARSALAGATAYWKETLGAFQVRTPDQTIDALANGWLLYQVIASRLWARTAFYQSSGAFGFRDQLQDVMALVHCAPDLVRQHLLRSASRQFIEGDVQHWWHPPSGKGIRTSCSDDYLWLPFVTSRYVEVTGDAAVLDVVCPFLESRPLKDGEVSNYGLPEVCATHGTLYEHCIRAIRHGLRYGTHGLPLMDGGDWNDGMNLVGIGGQGESVWLAFFLIAVLKQFAPLARGRDDSAIEVLCTSEATGLAQRVEATSWDDNWYRRAYFDDGAPLGSAANRECQIDSIAQSWAVLSGVAPNERARTAMASVWTHLVHTDTRVVQLLDPPFKASDPSPGYIQGYVAGVRENGGQYTHAAVWAALAFAKLGDVERAWQLFDLLNPIRHGDSAAAIATYQVEPYVVAGDVYAFAPHAGRGGWSWYTGSAGWMMQLLVEALFGLERQASQLRVHPLLPKDWPGFEMRYHFGTTRYDIACSAASLPGNASLRLDGIEAKDCVIALVDDGKPHAVIVKVWQGLPQAKSISQE